MKELIFSIMSLIYFIIGILFLLYYFKNKEKYKGKFCYNGIFFGIIIYYIVVPMILFQNIHSFMNYEKTRGIYGNNSIYKYIFNMPIIYIMFSVILIILFFIFFNLGYKYSNNRDIKRNIVIDSQKLSLLIKIFMYATLIVGGISLILLFVAFGGISNALSNGEYVRSFSNEASNIIGKYSLCIVSSKLVTITPFLAFYILERNKEKRKKIFYGVIFAISFVMSILYFLFNAGKFPLVCFLLALVYLLINGKVRRPWSVIIFICILGLPGIEILDNLFTFFGTGKFMPIKVNYIEYIYQFIHPIRNVVNVIPLTSLYGLKYFKDILFGTLNILPGIEYDPSYLPPSEYFYGVDWKSIGGIPNDFITYGYLQIGMIGVIIMALVLGSLLQRIDFRLSHIDGKSKEYIGAYLSINCFSLINNADTVSIVKGQFFLIVIFIILNLSKKRKVK